MTPRVLVLSAGVAMTTVACEAAEPPGRPLVTAVDGIVQPRRPVAEAVADAMRFLKKADGAYVPGRSEGELAGYFMSAHVNPDGTRTTRRQLSFPARHHAYFIRTFLRYHAYTGEHEWLLRARDLADWNIAHSTPAEAAWPHLPYSAFQDGKPTGSADKNSTEPDKAAFLGTGYLALYEATADARYLDAARRVAATLGPRQRADGSWPFRVVPTDGSVFQDLGGATVFYVEFFERLGRHEAKSEYARARASATRLMLARHVEQGQWGTYHEDVPPKNETHLSAEPMSFTADYLFRAAQHHPAYVEAGRRVLGQMEAKLVHTEGHAAAPAAAVAEQATFNHIMPGHTARYCLALAHLYAATRDEQARRRAFSGLHAVTHMQSGAGLFRTFFYDVNRQSDSGGNRPDWYSQHLYTVCHLLEAMACLPELAPAGEDHLLGSSVAVRTISYTPGVVRFETTAPSRTLLKLSFAPKVVTLGGRPLRETKPPGTDDGWSFDPATHLLTIQHGAGPVAVR